MRGKGVRDRTDLIEVREESRDEGMACLVIGNQSLVVLRGEDGLLLSRTEGDAIKGLLYVGLLYHGCVCAGGEDGGLIDEIGERGAGQAGGPPCY